MLQKPFMIRFLVEIKTVNKSRHWGHRYKSIYTKVQEQEIFNYGDRIQNRGVVGWKFPQPQICPHPNLQWMWPSSEKIFTNVIKLKILKWDSSRIIQMGSKSNDKCPYERHTEERNGRRPVKIEAENSDATTS